MEKDNFDFKKVKQFVGSVLEDYHNHKDIEKLCILRDTENTDGSFTQIGIRPLVDADMLLPDKNGVAFDPRLPAIGMDVANGEREFLIKNILNEFKPEEFVKLDKLEDFPAHIYTFRNPILLVSLKFFVEIHNLMIKRITWKDYKTLLDSKYELIFVPENYLGNKIIIIDKGVILWQKQKFKNGITGTDENLDIKIRSHGLDKIDILIRSVNKMKILDKEGIKVLEVKDEK